MPEHCVRVSGALRNAGHIDLITILKIQFLVGVWKSRSGWTDVVGMGLARQSSHLSLFKKHSPEWRMPSEDNSSNLF